jgi:hypothetical protein
MCASEQDRPLYSAVLQLSATECDGESCSNGHHCGVHRNAWNSEAFIELYTKILF